MRDLDNTTVGEILDTPELLDVFKRLAPQILEHPLLEAGRSFNFEACLPYLTDMLDDDTYEAIKGEFAKL